MEEDVSAYGGRRFIDWMKTLQRLEEDVSASGGRRFIVWRKTLHRLEEDASSSGGRRFIVWRKTLLLMQIAQMHDMRAELHLLSITCLLILAAGSSHKHPPLAHSLTSGRSSDITRRSVRPVRPDAPQQTFPWHQSQEPSGVCVPSAEEC
ncbi:uncharacterized protein V6R79_020645 [Siganus canaliculatus]